MDRLKELKRGAPVPESVSIDVDTHRDSNSRTQEFFGDVDIVKNNIVVITEATQTIYELNQNIKQASTSDAEQESFKQIQVLVKATNKKAAIAKHLIQRFREDNVRLKTSNDSASNASDIRIRENLTNTLTRKMVEVMNGYQAAQTKVKNDMKEKVKKQIQIVKPNATVEEIDAIFRSDGTSSNLMKSTILQGDSADSIRNAYIKVADKYQDVLNLEASVASLHQMFLDFALLTENQGELLDRIEYQVKGTTEYIDSGNRDIAVAIDTLKLIRSKQCCVAVIVLLILGIIAGVLAAHFQN